MGGTAELSSTTEHAAVISISDLLQLGRPLTGAAASSRHPTPGPRVPTAVLSSSLSEHLAARTSFAFAEPTFFYPLGFPAVLVGALSLYSGGDSHSSGCGNYCLSFSDGSGRVCCDILELDVTTIGKDIRVVAWNFIPLQSGGGFLEINKFSIKDDPELGSARSPPGPSCFPPFEERSGFRSCAWGVLVSVSPVFSVPLSVQERTSHVEATGVEHSVGFLSEMSACKCGYCAEARSFEDLYRCLQVRNGHSFDRRVFIYFRGSSSSWRTVLSKLVGRLTIISGLKKKYISSGGRESLMLVSSKKTVVYSDINPLDRELARRRPRQAKVQLGSYCGVVTGVFKGGTVIELDKKDVWLLIAHPLLNLPHSLRVGALIVVKNVLFVSPKISSLRILLLGSCVRTTIEIKSFSPADTRCYFINRSHSALWLFIDSLPLSAKFWVLLMISCFHKKFGGIFSHKEILGSRKLHVGSKIKNGDSNTNLLYCEGMYQQQMLKRVISSAEFGLVLVGCLQVSPSSGRLQLVDSTGHLDIVIPDLSCNLDPHAVYEVTDYTLIITGFAVQLDPLISGLSDPVSCRSILHNFQLKEKSCEPVIYAHFHTRSLRSLKTPFPPVSINDDLRSGSEDFHLLLITHKFLHVQNLPRKLSVLNKPSAFAEAISLPYKLTLLGKYRHLQSSKVSERLECSDDFPCLMSLNGVTYQGNLVPYNFFHKDGNSLEFPVFKQDGRKILLEFDFDSIDKFQKINIGTYCVMKLSKEETSSAVKKHIEDLDCTKAFVTSQTGPWSVKLSLRKFPHPCSASQDQLSGGFSVESDVSHLRFADQNKRLLHSCPDIVQQHLDAHLHLSHRIMELDKAKLLEKCVSEVYNTLEPVFSVTSFIQTMASIQLHPSGPVKHQSRLPEGNLVSLRGNIMNIHICHDNHHGGTTRWSNKFSADCTMCIHVHESQHVVKIRGIFGAICPLGMLPGANATFHRLLTINSYGRYELMLIPVSYIVVNYVDPLDMLPIYGSPLCLHNNLISTPSLNIQKESLPVAPSRLISALNDSSYSSRFQLNSRVIETIIFTFEKQIAKPKNLQQIQKCKALAIMVPLAGFILDDGSSTCCCWADRDRAELLLQLNETALISFGSSQGTSKMMRNNHCTVTVEHLLRKMIKKHSRITIKSHRSRIESTMMDTTYSIDSKKALTSLEEDVLQFIVMNAQNGPNLSVTGYMLSSNELPWSEDDFARVDFIEWPMKHFWAEEVVHTSPLMEGRNLIKDLLPG